MNYTLAKDQCVSGFTEYASIKNKGGMMIRLEGDPLDLRKKTQET